MSHAEVEDLLRKVAAEKAAFDGEPVGPVYLHAAAHEISGMLRQALDKALNPPRRPEAAPAAEPEPSAPGADAPAEVAPLPAKSKRPAKSKSTAA